jgi:hypothetical protein
VTTWTDVPWPDGIDSRPATPAELAHVRLAAFEGRLADARRLLRLAAGGAPERLRSDAVALASLAARLQETALLELEATRVAAEPRRARTTGGPG